MIGNALNQNILMTYIPKNRKFIKKIYFLAFGELYT